MWNQHIVGRTTQESNVCSEVDTETARPKHTIEKRKIQMAKNRSGFRVRDGPSVEHWPLDMPNGPTQGFGMAWRLDQCWRFAGLYGIFPWFCQFVELLKLSPVEELLGQCVPTHSIDRTNAPKIEHFSTESVELTDRLRSLSGRERVCV